MYHLRRIKTMLLMLLMYMVANAQLEDGKVYNFVNIGNSSQSMVITSDNRATITATNTSSYDQLWYVSTNNDGSYLLRNLANGYYLRSPNATSARWTMVKGDELDAQCMFSCTAVGSGYTLRAIYDGNDHGYMHYGANNGGIVCWNTNAAATQWTITEVSISSTELDANWEKLSVVDPDESTVKDYQTALDNLFTDKACTTPMKSLTTEAAIIADADYQALPEGLRKMVLKVYLDNWAEDNYDSNKSGWGADYAKKYRVQMYEPYNEPVASAAALGINPHTNLNNPTGVFANMQEPLYVMVGGEIEDGASLYLASYVGHAQLGEYNDGVELKEGLNVVPSFFDGTNYCINYVVHTFDTSDGKRGNKAKARRLSDYDDLKIHIEGGYINGYWNKVGDELYAPDKAANWDYIETRATQTDVTVLGEYMALQFPLGMDADGNNGLSYYFNDKVDINAVIDAWDNIMRWERIVLGILHKDTIEKYAEESPYSDKPYVFESTANDGDDFATDYSDYYNMHGLAIGDNSTYMSGGWKSSNYNCNTLESIIQHLPTDAGSHWGPAHEIGHQHQAMIKMGGEMEVSNNLFSNVVMWYFGKTTSRVNGTNGLLSSVLANFNKEDGHYLTNSIWGMTQMYYKLFLYYHVLGHNPKFYPRLFEMLRQDPQQQGKGNIDGANAQLHLYKKVCQAAGEDLTEFFRAHGFFVPLDGFSINDYGIYTFYMTQEQIDEAIAEVKAWAEANGVEENTAILFINDVTGEEIISHKGNVLTLHGETTTLADLGSYATFDEATQSDYTYSVVGNTVTMEGTGGVGFAIYNAEGEIIAFSNNKTFEISDECAALIASGEAEFKVVNADNTVTEPVDVMDTDDTESKYAALGELLEEVEKILALSDDTDKTYPGFYKGGAVATLKSLYTSASEVYTNKTTASYTSAYESLYQEYVNVVTLDSDKVPFLSGSTYVLTNKLHSGKSMTINDKDTLYCATTNINDAKQQWVFEPATDEDTYYLKNVGNNKYLRTLSKSGKTDALANSTADALPYKLFDLGEGLWALQCQNELEEKVSLHCDNSSNIVGWWHTASDNDGSWWYLTATNVVETDLPRYELENLVQKTEELMAEVGKVAVGEANALTLTESNYYCNAECKETTYGDQFTSYSVLFDGSSSTFLHTDYSSQAPSEDHYIRIDMGADNGLQYFNLNYTTRGSGNVCAPTKMAIEVSNDATNWVTLRDITSGLPTGNDASCTIKELGYGTSYRYVRMRVYETSGSRKANGHCYFILSELGLSMISYAETLNSTYESMTEGVLLDAFKANLAAQGVLITATTSAEYKAAYTTLETKYNALLAAKKVVDDAALNAKKAELQTLIDNTTSLISSCGTVTYTPATYSGDVALQVNNSTGDFYLTTNSQQSNELSVGNLLDNATNTYYHSSWSAAADDDHYLQVNLGEGKGLAEFTFTYTTRESYAYPSPAPTKIQVYGSNDGESFEALLATFTSSDEDNALPAYDEGATEWTSTSIKGAESYDYLRFYVREAQGPGTDEVEGNGHHYFAMSEFSLTAIGTPESYTVELGNDAGGATNALMLAAYKENASAQATHTLATTLSQVEEAIAKLQADYDALKSAKETIVEKTYYVQVVGGNANGGVVYGGNSHLSSDSFEAPINLTVDDLTAISLDGYAVPVVTLNGTTITVTYNKTYTVQVTGGGGNGGVTYNEQNYADGATFDAQQSSFTKEDLTAIVPEGYTLKEVTVDHEAGVISVSYTAIPLVDTAKYYTLACKATDHSTFIRDNGSVFNGRSAEGSLFQFEAADEDNGYYIKSYVSDKYLNCTANENTENDAVVESEEKSTVWKMAKPKHTDGVVTLTAGYDKYLNNKGDAPTYLLARYHNGGPASNNACSLWTLTESEPLDMSDLAALIDATNILIASCYTDDVLNYVNSAYVTEASLTTVRSVVADAQAKYDSKATVASEYAAAMTALQTAKETLSANIASANTEATERAQLRTDLNTLIGETNELITLCGTTPGDATETLINEVSALVASAQTVADNTGSTADELTAATTALQAKYDVLNAAQQSTAKADLRTLIAQTEVLIDECGVIDYSTYPVETPIALQAKNNGENYWVSSNADHNHTAADGTTYTDGGGIAALVDNSESTYFHTRWGGDAVNESHYIQVDMGEGVSIQEFVFSYKPRDPSPAPTAMTIYGSNDGTTFEDELAIITSGLPAYNSGKTYTSDVIGSDTEYRYLRFTVTESNGPGKKVFSGYYFFGMLEFDLTSITYETDYHVESLNPNGSVTEEQLLEVFNAKMAAAELANSSYDKTALEAETASLQALYDALQVAYETKQVPVTLTTDHENPVLYTIKSKRGETKTVQYEPASSHMFSIAEASEGSAKQAFYFMAGDERTQVYVYPYAAGQQVLAADNTGNGAAKVFVEEKTASQAKQWTFEKETIDNVDYYSLKVVGGSTYFSHFGGGSNKMGFYIAKDEGSRMTFAETTIEGSGAYNSLKVYYDEAAKGAGSKIEGGEGVGYYPVAEAEVYNAAYDVATTVLSDNASDYAAYLAAYNTLLDANEALVINMPEEGKYYTIVSACSDHRNGQLMYATSENAIVFSREMTNVKPEALWKFTAEGYLENLQTGCSVSTESTGGDHHKLGESPRVVSIKAISLDGQVLLTPEGAHPLHAQDNGSVVVGYNDTDAGTASAWRIVEVDVTDVVHTVSIGQYEHAGLYLNYPVTIPDDVKAYYLDGSDISIDNGVGTLKMTLIEDRVLPARTAVILYAPGGGDYEFRYATEDVIAYDDNLLTGSTYQTYREAAPNYYYYVFGQNNGEIGLYKNGVKYDANGAEGNTHYKMSANKVLFAWDGATQSVSSFRFRFGGQTTGVEDEAMENEAIIYDLFGRRLLEVTTSGLYIVNGEKCYIQVK